MHSVIVSPQSETQLVFWSQICVILYSRFIILSFFDISFLKNIQEIHTFVLHVLKSVSHGNTSAISTWVPVSFFCAAFTSTNPTLCSCTPSLLALLMHTFLCTGVHKPSIILVFLLYTLPFLLLCLFSLFPSILPLFLSFPLKKIHCQWEPGFRKVVVLSSLCLASKHTHPEICHCRWDVGHYSRSIPSRSIESAFAGWREHHPLPFLSQVEGASACKNCWLVLPSMGLWWWSGSELRLHLDKFQLLLIMWISTGH